MGEIYAESAGLVEVVTEVVEAGKSIVNEAKMPEKYWKKGENNAEKELYNKSMIHLPPIFGGVGDGVIDEMTEKLQFLKMGLSIVENPGQIKQAWNNSINGLSNLKFADIKEGLREQVAEITSGTDVGMHKGGVVMTQMSSTLIGGVAGSMLLEDLVKRAKKVFNLKILKKRIQSHLNLSTWVDKLHPHLDEDLIKRIDDIAVNNPSKLADINDLYSTDKFKMTASRVPANAQPPFRATINGVNVEYNVSGFPDFKPHGGGPDFEVKSSTLTGTGSATSGDFKFANDLAARNPNLAGRFRIIPNSQRCEIKINNQWVECTWHHYQDGRTMFPVPSDIHVAFAHTGGKAIISKGLQDLFQ